MDEGGLHLLAIEARNFMGLTALELKVPDEGLIASGDNGSGKTSALSILSAAFGGKNAEPAVPIHAGTYDAEVRVIAGRDGKPALKVEKTWEPGKDGKVASKLTVWKIDADGKLDKQASPQKVLDALYDAVSFDIGAFLQPPGAKTAEAVAKEQTALLLRACPLDVDLDALAVKRKGLYDDRTLANREHERNVAALRLLAKAEVPARVDLDAKRAKVREALGAAATLKAATDRVTAIDREIADLRARFDKLAAERKAAVEQAQAAQAAAVDTTALETEISAGERTNEAAIRVAAANEKYDGLLKSVGESKREIERLEAGMAEIDRTKAEALARASFPYPGLGVDDVLGVTLAQDGAVVPLAQVNLAKRVEVAFRVLAKLHKGLKVARIFDGNALDGKTLALLWRTARVLGVQLLIERVAADQPGSVVFENGRVAYVVGAEKGGSNA